MQKSGTIFHFLIISFQSKTKKVLTEYNIKYTPRKNINL